MKQKPWQASRSWAAQHKTNRVDKIYSLESHLYDICECIVNNLSPKCCVRCLPMFTDTSVTRNGPNGDVYSLDSFQRPNTIHEQHTECTQRAQHKSSTVTEKPHRFSTNKQNNGRSSCQIRSTITDISKWGCMTAARPSIYVLPSSPVPWYSILYAEEHELKANAYPCTEPGRRSWGWNWKYNCMWHAESHMSSSFIDSTPHGSGSNNKSTNQQTNTKKHHPNIIIIIIRHVSLFLSQCFAVRSQRLFCDIVLSHRYHKIYPKIKRNKSEKQHVISGLL